MKRIILILFPVVLLILALRPAGSYTIHGIVSDESGQPLKAVSITVREGKGATSTASDGSYTIQLKDDQMTLVYTHPGFISKEIIVAGKKEVNLTLYKKTSTSLDAKKDLLNAPVEDKLAGQQEVVVTRQPLMLEGTVSGVRVGRGKANKMYAPASGNGLYGDDFEDFNREGYDAITENGFLKSTDNPLSTFSIDVDAASYSNVRRYLNQGILPPSGAVRIEEMVNYFKYQYPQPKNDLPFTVNSEISDAPWNKEHKLVLIGLQGKQIPVDNLPASNITFLIDVSGSMQGENRLGLVKSSMKLLTDQLREEDKVSIVVYAGAAGLVLEPTSGSNKTKIKEAIDQLEAGGSTAGGEGIKLAYKTAQKNFVKNGNNRVILCTDGDFNVGESSDDAMERLIVKERESGVFLTVLGYGMGNYQDAKMQKLADKGNGNHAYIDGISEAKKVLVNEFGGTLFTIAKDVKLQIEFNPAKVQAYRLIGYENRLLAKEDFNNDKKDAGELGSGHTVTALYEIIPVGVKSEFIKNVDPLKYQKEIIAHAGKQATDEIMTVKLRYKKPDADKSALIEQVIKDESTSIASTSNNFRFAAAVAEFGMLLRDSEFKSSANFEQVVKMAKAAKGADDEGYRSEFIRLVESAQLLANTKKVDSDKKDIGIR